MATRTAMRAGKPADGAGTTAGKAARKSPKKATQKTEKNTAKSTTRNTARNTAQDTATRAVRSRARSADAATPRAAGGATSPRTAAAADGASAAERIDRRIASLGDWRGERLAWIRALVHEVAPDVVEEWKWMGTPVWSCDGMLVLANPHKDKVKLTFFHGARLDDPDGLFNAGLAGNRWRAIDFRRGDAPDRAALARLLRAAIAYNRTHAVPRSRGSRG